MKELSNYKHFHFSDFTRTNYRRLLQIAKKNYIFSDYTDFNKSCDYILWRHDIDFSVHSALQMAKIEAEEGVRSTYFLLLHSEFYNLFESEVSKLVYQIIELGHAIGLHFDCSYYSVSRQQDLEKYLGLEKRIIKEFFGKTPQVFSIHIPTSKTSEWDQWEYCEMINVNSQYFKREVEYCSDSNGYWRFRRLEDVLKQPIEKGLQILTHPSLWQDKVMSPKERVWRCIDGRAEKTKMWYNDILHKSNRLNIDWNEPQWVDKKG